MDKTTSTVEELFLKLMETGFTSIQELKGQMSHLRHQQNELLRHQQIELIDRVESLRESLECLSRDIRDSHAEISKNLNELKDGLNMFTRRVDILNRDILSVKAEQEEISERIDYPKDKKSL